MQPTSPAQFAASGSGIVAPLEQVRPDVWALAVAMPGGHIPYSFAYLVRDSDGGVHVIDPGWNSDENMAALESALVGMGHGFSDVRSIVATHMHPDHLGLADRLRIASGAPVALPSREQQAISARSPVWPPPTLAGELELWGVPLERRPEIIGLDDRTPLGANFVADLLLGDDERLDIPGFDIITMMTPGHTAGHLCLRDGERGLLFTGDHVLPTVHGGLGLGGKSATNPLADYLSSLARVARFDDHEALPGHGYRFTGLAERAAEHAEHHLTRSREVAAVIVGNGKATIWQIAAELTWTAGWANLTGFFLFSALSQIQLHRDYVLTRES